MKLEAVSRIRMHTQHLLGPVLDTATDVVDWLGAVQSQELAAAHWSLGQRSRATYEDVAQAFAAGTILRTHVLRPTWHFVLPADLRWMMRLSAPRIRTRMSSMDRKIGADALVGASNDAIARALEDGPATRTELGAALARKKIVASGQLLGHLVMHAELALVACSGPPRGKQQTYARVDDRVPPSASISDDEAIVRLAQRYFRSHGPATLTDFVWWAGLGVREARRGIEEAGLEKLAVDDRVYWFVPPLAKPAKGPLRAHLLQAYDEYSVAYTESRDVLGELQARATKGAQSFAHLVVVDGKVVGFWRRGVRPDLALARTVDAKETRAIEQEIARYQRFTVT